MDKRPDNVANGGDKFYLVDYVAKKQPQEVFGYDDEFVAADAIVTLAETKPVDELLMVATAYGMNTDRDLLKSSMTCFRRQKQIHLDS